MQFKNKVELVILINLKRSFNLSYEKLVFFFHLFFQMRKLFLTNSEQLYYWVVYLFVYFAIFWAIFFMNA